MGRRWPNQTRLVEVQRVRDLSRSITQKAHPQTSRVSKTKKQTPSWVVLPPTAPQSPQKENKGKDPGLASAPGEREARGGWRPGPDRTLTQNDHVPPVMRTARGGENTSGAPWSESFSSGSAAVLWVGTGRHPETVRKGPSRHFL